MRNKTWNKTFETKFFLVISADLAVVEGKLGELLLASRECEHFSYSLELEVNYKMSPPNIRTDNLKSSFSQIL